MPSKYTSYDTEIEFTTSLGDQQIRFISKPGLPYWDRLNPSYQLIVKYLRPSPHNRILLFGGGHGAIAVWLAQQLLTGELWLYETNFLALALSKKTFQINQTTNCHIFPDKTFLSETQNLFDNVVLFLPKGRKLFQRCIVQSWDSMKIGGRLYLAGAKNLGIKTAIKDVHDLFGNSTVLGYKKGHRIAVFEKKELKREKPRWFFEPGISVETWFKFSITRDNHILTLVSLPGVFSYDRLDEGTELLLDQFPDLHGARVLDLGCGYGIVGITAHQAGAKVIDLVDVNLLATACAKRNIANFCIENARVIPSDVTSSVNDQYYDFVISNPPFHSGKSVDYNVSMAFLTQSHQRLSPGGQLLLVGNKFLDYGKKLRDIYSKVDIVKETNKFQVFRARK